MASLKPLSNKSEKPNISATTLESILSVRNTFANMFGEIFGGAVDSSSVQGGTSRSVSKGKAKAQTPGNNRTKTIQQAVYTTIAEGQNQKLKSGEGVANVFAKIYNLMKLDHDEKRKQFELDKNFASEKKENQERRDKELFGLLHMLTGHPKAPAPKVEKENNSSLITKVLGGMLSGVASIFGGLLKTIWFIGKFIGSISFGITKALGSIVTTVVGALTPVLASIATFVFKEVKNIVIGAVEFLGRKILGLLIGQKGGRVSGKNELAASLAVGALVSGVKDDDWLAATAGGIGATIGGVVGGPGGALTGFNIGAGGVESFKSIAGLNKEQEEIRKFLIGEDAFNLENSQKSFLARLFTDKGAFTERGQEKIAELQQQKIEAAQEYHKEMLEAMGPRYKLVGYTDEKNPIIPIVEKDGKRLGLKDFAEEYAFRTHFQGLDKILGVTPTGEAAQHQLIQDTVSGLMKPLNNLKTEGLDILQDAKDEFNKGMSFASSKIDEGIQSFGGLLGNIGVDTKELPSIFKDIKGKFTSPIVINSNSVAPTQEKPPIISSLGFTHVRNDETTLLKVQKLNYRPV